MFKLYKLKIVAFALLTLLVFGCAMKAGRTFPVEQVRNIEIGLTTKEDIQQAFGDPWRTGIEDGFKTWTYGQYNMNNSRDLVIRFDDAGIVKSYSFSSSFPEDKDL